jgi:hypothetical protein
MALLKHQRAQHGLGGQAASASLASERVAMLRSSLSPFALIGEWASSGRGRPRRRTSSPALLRTVKSGELGELALGSVKFTSHFQLSTVRCRRTEGLSCPEEHHASAPGPTAATDLYITCPMQLKSQIALEWRFHA